MTLFLLGQLQRNAESLDTADLLKIGSPGSISTTSLAIGNSYSSLRILAELRFGVDGGYRRLIGGLIGWFFLFFFFFETIWWA